MHNVKKGLGIAFRFGVRAFLIFPVLPFLYLIEPVYRIRLGTMYTQRIGHLAVNTETFMRKHRYAGFPKRTLFIFAGYDPSNKQLMKMWLRLKGDPVIFTESRLLARIFFAWRNILKHTRFWDRQATNFVEYTLYSKTEPILNFTKEEEQAGVQALADMGIPPSSWFVPIHVRDAAYLTSWRPELAAYWKRVEQRNCNIENFLATAKHIAELGGYAIRVGSIVDSPLPKSLHPRIIDYATKYRSDFMDIYLGAKCRFYIGTSSGPDALADIFNKPLLGTNQVPYNMSRNNKKSIILPRLLTSRETGEIIPFYKARDEGYYKDWEIPSSMHPSKDLFIPVENSAEDILDGVKDMLDGLDGPPANPEDQRIQDSYGKEYLSIRPDYKMAGNIGRRFARKYRNLIEPSKPSIKPATYSSLSEDEQSSIIPNDSLGAVQKDG